MAGLRINELQGLPVNPDYEAFAKSLQSAGIGANTDMAQAAAPSMNEDDYAKFEADLGGFVKGKNPLVQTAKGAVGHGVKSLGTALKDVGLPMVGQPIQDYGQQVMENNPQRIQSLTDVLQHPLTAIQEGIGQAVGSLPPTIAGSWAGAKAGAALPLPPQGKAIAAGLGGLAGAFAPNLLAEYGETRDKQAQTGIDDKAKALGYGTAAAGVDLVADATLIGKVLPKPLRDALPKILELPQGATFVQRLAQAGKAGMLGAGMEGATEAVQTYLERLGGGQPIDTDEAHQEALLSGVMGALGGGAIRGGMELVSPNVAQPEQPPASDQGQTPPVTQQPPQSGPQPPTGPSTPIIPGMRGPGGLPAPEPVAGLLPGYDYLSSGTNIDRMAGINADAAAQDQARRDEALRTIEQANTPPMGGMPIPPVGPPRPDTQGPTTFASGIPIPELGLPPASSPQAGGANLPALPAPGATSPQENANEGQGQEGGRGQTLLTAEAGGTPPASPFFQDNALTPLGDVHARNSSAFLPEGKTTSRDYAGMLEDEADAKVIEDSPGMWEKGTDGRVTFTPAKPLNDQQRQEIATLREAADMVDGIDDQYAKRWRKLADNYEFTGEKSQYLEPERLKSMAAGIIRQHNAKNQTLEPIEFTPDTPEKWLTDYRIKKGEYLPKEADLTGIVDRVNKLKAFLASKGLTPDKVDTRLASTPMFEAKGFLGALSGLTERAANKNEAIVKGYKRANPQQLKDTLAEIRQMETEIDAFLEAQAQPTDTKSGQQDQSADTKSGQQVNPDLISSQTEPETPNEPQPVPGPDEQGQDQATQVRQDEAKAPVTTPGTALSWSNLDGWNKAGQTLDKRPASTKKNEQRGQHIEALLASDAIERETDPAVLNQAKATVDLLHGKPPRGKRGGSSYESFINRVNNRLAALGKSKKPLNQQLKDNQASNRKAGYTQTEADYAEGLARLDYLTHAAKSNYKAHEWRAMQKEKAKLEKRMAKADPGRFTDPTYRALRNKSAEFHQGMMKLWLENMDDQIAWGKEKGWSSDEAYQHWVDNHPTKEHPFTRSFFNRNYQEAKNAQQEQKPGAPDGGGGTRPGVRQEGGSAAEGGAGVQSGGQGQQAPEPGDEEAPEIKTNLAQQAKARQRAKQDRIIQPTDSLLTAIAKAGGLDVEDARRQGIDPRYFKLRGHKIFRVFTRNGLTFDDMAHNILKHHGYAVTGANDLLEAVDNELRGQKQYTQAGYEAQAEQDAQAMEADYLDLLDSPGFAFEEDDYGPNMDAYSRRMYELATLLDKLEDGAGEAILERGAIANENHEDILQQLRDGIRQRIRALRAAKAEGGQEAGTGTETPEEGFLQTQTVTPVRAPPKPEQTEDIFGNRDDTAQALADREREQDQKRNGTQDIPASMGPGDLFSGGQGQADITDQPQAVTVPEGYKTTHEYYSDGKTVVGYSKFLQGEQVRDKESGLQGTVETYIGPGPVFNDLLVKWDSGLESRIAASKLEALPVEPAPETDSLKPVIDSLASHDEFRGRIMAGEATADDVRAAFESLVANKEAILKDLKALKKPDLLRRAGMRARQSESKEALAKSAYSDMLTSMPLRDAFTWSPFTESLEDAVRRMLSTLTDAEVKAWAEARTPRDTALPNIPMPIVRKLRAYGFSNDEIQAMTPDQREGAIAAALAGAESVVMGNGTPEHGYYISTGDKGAVYTLRWAEVDPITHRRMDIYVANLGTDKNASVTKAKAMVAARGRKALFWDAPDVLADFEEGAGSRQSNPEELQDLSGVEATGTTETAPGSAPRDVSEMSPQEIVAHKGLVVHEKVSRAGKTYWAVSGSTLDHKDILDALGFGTPFKMQGVFYRSVFDADPTEKLAAALAGNLAPKEPLPELERDQAQVLIAQRKLEVIPMPDGEYHVTGKTYDYRVILRTLGGIWNGEKKAYIFRSDPTGALGYAINEIKAGADDTESGEVDHQDERRRQLREREDARDDERRDSVIYSGIVGKQTRDLIEKGKQYGIPDKVVREQIEDVGMIVSAKEAGKRIFILANSAGTGKTFVLGGAIRELRDRGVKKFRYVTMSQDLIAQIQSNLAAYDLTGVSFNTYAELSAKPLDTTGEVLILDESQNVKNIADGTKRAVNAESMIGGAEMTIFASATPYQNPVEVQYMSPTGLFDGVGGWAEWVKMYGAAVKRRKFYNYQTGREEVEETIYWPGRGKKEDGAAARQWILKQGIMTQRIMQIDPDMVDTRFERVPVEQSWLDIYNQVDGAYEALTRKWTNEDGQPIDAMVFAQIAQHRENTLKRVLEASKVKQAIQIAQARLDEGKSVVIFVETKSDRTLGLWRKSGKQDDGKLYTYPQMQALMAEWERERGMARMMNEAAPPRPFVEFILQIAGEFHDRGIMTELPSTADEIVNALGKDRVGIYTGAVTQAKAKQDKEAFLSGKKQVLVATMAKGGTGLSLHDTVGNRPTAQINLNLPWSAYQVDQVSGRVARYGLQSKAEIAWLFASNIPWEASKLAPRVGARMRDMGAIIKGIEVRAAEILDGEFDFEGQMDVSQVEEDAAITTPEEDIYETAARLERNRRPPSSSDQDFFPTPYPLAALMTRIAGVKPGHRLLEPSGGDGNLLRFLPQDTLTTVVELRQDNVQKLHIRYPDAKVDKADFLAWEGGKGFDTVLMNPPFSQEKGIGSLDAAHVRKAFDLLGENGRLVAIMGEGVFFRSNTKDTAFREWLDDVGATVIKLPPGAFKQSGTMVNARMIVLDKNGDPGRNDMDLSDVSPDSLRDIEFMVPSRVSVNYANQVEANDAGIKTQPQHPQPTQPAFTPDEVEAMRARIKQAYGVGDIEIPQYMMVQELFARKQYADIKTIVDSLAQLDQGDQGRMATEEGRRKTRARGKADLDRLLSMIGSQMYKANLADVTIKEMVQNSFDAVKASVGKKLEKEGQIDIITDYSKRLIIIRDNGQGMTPKIIRDAFLTLAGSSKEGLEKGQASGGFGMAKAAFLVGNERIWVRTARNGVRSTFVTNGSEIFNKDIEITEEKVDKDEHGTTIVVKVPEYVTVEGEQRHVWFPSNPGSINFFDNPMLDDRVTINQGHLNRWDEFDPAELLQPGVLRNVSLEPIPVAKHFDMSKYAKFTTAKFKWGEADLYFATDRAKKSWEIKHWVLSSGIYQFDRQIPEGTMSFSPIPYNIIINVRPNVTGESAIYPFDIRREGWKGTIEEDVKAMTAYLQRVAAGKEAENTVESFKNIRALPKLNVEASSASAGLDIADFLIQKPAGRTEEAPEERYIPPVVNVGGGVVTGKDKEGNEVTYADVNRKKDEKVGASFETDVAAPTALDYLMDVGIDHNLAIFHNNTNVDYNAIGGSPAEMMFAEFGSIMLALRDKVATLSSYKALTDPNKPTFVGISIDKSYHGVNIKVPFSGALLNPLAVKGKTLQSIAMGLYETMIHEFAHEQVRNHNPEFQMAFHALSADMASDGTDLDTRVQLARVLKKHQVLFNELRDEFNKSTTANTAKSLDEDKEGGAVASTRTGPGPLGSDEGIAGAAGGAVPGGRDAGRNTGVFADAGGGQFGQVSRGPGPDSEGPAFSRGGRQGVTTSRLREVLASQFGKGIENLVRNGTLHIVQSLDDPQVPRAIREFARGDEEGAYWQGKVYLFANNVSEARAKAVLLHELGEHFGLKTMLGAKGYAQLQARINALYRTGNARVREAWDAVLREYRDDQGRLLFREGSEKHLREVIARLGENEAFTKTQWWKSLLSSIKAFLLRMGFGRVVNSLSDADLNALLVASVRQAAKEAATPAFYPAQGTTQASRPAAVFYSELARQLGQAKAAKAPPAQWKAIIKGLPGVKADEIEWSGVMDYLDLVKGPVTREQLQAFVEKNGVRLHDVEYGDVVPQADIQSETERRFEDELNRRMDDVEIPEAMVEETDDGEWVVFDADGEVDRIFHNEDKATARKDALDAQYAENARIEVSNSINWGDIEADVEQELADQYATSYSQYQLGGGENYRELLIALPTRAPDITGWTAEPIESAAGDRYVVKDGKGNEVAKVYADSPELAIRDAMRVARNSQRTFQSSHWEGENILAHVRFNERTTPDGKRVLFLEELQSDWGQRGKKEGFGRQPGFSVVFPDGLVFGNYESRTDAMRALSHANQGLKEDEKAKIIEKNDALKGIPAAPFVTDTKAWTALALKRMIRYAADNGYDRIAWTTGEQQAERYDLSKQVDFIDYRRLGPDSYKVAVVAKSGDEVFAEDAIGLKRIEEVLGKEIAQKIENGEGQPGGGRMTLRGLDLKVGGEGMRGYYDQIVPQVANSLLKRFGGNGVTQGEVSGERTRDASGIPSMYPEMLKQPGFDITPQLRDRALQGLPLFKRNDDRLARARTMGFDTRQVWYHGTPVGNDIRAFDLGKVGAKTGTREKAIFLTDTPDVAAAYAYQDEITMEGDKVTAEESYGSLYPVYIRGKLYDATAEVEGKRYNSKVFQAITEKAKAAGYAGVDFGRVVDVPAGTPWGTPPGRVIAMFRPGDIRSIHAAFDPARAGLDDLLFSRPIRNPDRQYTQEQERVVGRLDLGTPPGTVQKFKNRFAAMRGRVVTHIRQAIVDRYASFADILGSERLWMLSHLSHTAGGSIEAVLKFGGPKLDASGALDINTDVPSMKDVIDKVGGYEADDFFRWIAGNRAANINAKADRAQRIYDQMKVMIRSMKKDIQRLQRGEALTQPDAYAKARIATLKTEIKELKAEVQDIIYGNITIKGRTYVNGLNKLITYKEMEIGMLKDPLTQRDKAKLINAMNKVMRQMLDLARQASKAKDIRERFLTEADIAALMTLNQGTTADGQDRAQLYEEARQMFEKLNAAVVDVAVQTGTVSEQDAERWATEGFYVPFYRFLENDDGDNTYGVRGLDSLTGQTAYKQFKGADIPLNDLLTNVALNWHHLLDSALKNQAAREALSLSEDMGIARKVNSNLKRTGDVFVRIEGKRQYYRLDDTPDAKLVAQSLAAMQYKGLNNFAMKAMNRFKRALTFGVTISPQFKIRNLIRDSIQAIAAADMSTNVAKNLTQGWNATHFDSQTYARMIMSGGAFGDSGYLYGGAITRESVLSDIGNEQLLDTQNKLWDLMKSVFQKYQDFGARLENVNRAANFDQKVQRGDTLLSAAFSARDQLDFSRHGALSAVYELSQVVPFLQARLNGLDKLYRAMNDPKQRKQFWAVTGTYVLASVALYLAMKDDDDYKELEQWKRDAYHAFKLPGSDVMYFIPRPFEIGSLAAVAERAVEQTVDDKVHGILFAERLGHILADNLSFNPTPQLFVPALEVQANKDFYTGRRLENLGMEQLNPVQRKRAWTSDTAIALSKGMDAILWDKAVLSPIQIEHLVNGYLGWLGGATLGTLDFLYRTATNAPAKPAWKPQDYPVAGGFMSEGPQRNTRYVTEFYEHLDVMNKTYADIRHAITFNRPAEAREIARENAKSLAWRARYNKIQDTLAKLNRRAELIQYGNLPGPMKRVQLDTINAERDRLTKQIVEQSSAAF